MIRKSDLTLTPCEHLSVAVTLTDGAGRRTVARLTGGDGCDDIELAAMPPEQAGVTAMHLESLTRALRAHIRGVDGGMPGLDFDRRYRPVATARQVLAVAEQLAANHRLSGRRRAGGPRRGVRPSRRRRPAHARRHGAAGAGRRP